MDLVKHGEVYHALDNHDAIQSSYESISGALLSQVLDPGELHVAAMLEDHFNWPSGLVLRLWVAGGKSHVLVHIADGRIVLH